MGITSEAVADDQDRIIPMGQRQLDDEVHADGLPRPVRDVERAEESVRLVARSLDASALLAGSDVAAHVLSELGP
ncbi:hypothetical protein FKP32DRAFT_1583659 [Trametes sanguinea]|nr:hypothetical protein FKP32DRAFT_1583659 [Trametes sanguinea]